ncbi:MAG: substrate-binding domain-containing protein [Acidimicrobiales bacterium]|nr:substrate-binding domain-containing protein [Acidimicrobiales bacterium]
MKRPRSALLLALRLLLACTVLLAVAGCSDDEEPTSSGSRGTASDAATKPTVGAGDRATTVTIYAPDQLQRAMNELKGGFEFLTEYTVVITQGSETDLIAGVQGGDRPNLLVADTTELMPLVDNGTIIATPTDFGTDPLLMLTAKGNPEGVPAQIGVFGEGSAFVTGLCAPDVPCGAAAQSVLQQAGVTPAADTVEPTGRRLTDNVAKGKVDVALVFRSDYMNRFFRTGALADPDFAPYVITYDIGTIEETDASKAFLEFLGSIAGRTILVQRGLLPLGSV